MLENLRSYLQDTFTFLVGDLVETAARERKTRTGRARRTIALEGPEPLERRITPTVDYWTATTAGDWSNAQNWTDENGAHVVPTASSDVVFGQLSGNSDCTMSVPGGVTVNSLTINALYGSSHTLTLNTSLNIESDMTIASGNIAQPNGAASTITCQGGLSWSNGKIGSQTNSASNLNIYNETSGTSVISGRFSHTLGDNLQLGGDLNITNDSDNQLVLANNANITNGGEIDLNGGGAIGITNAQGSNGSIINGTVKATGATGSQNLECVPIVNSTSTSQLIVGDANGTATTLEITGSNSQNGVSFYNNGGTIKIYTGATFRPWSGFTQQSGFLEIDGTGKAFISGPTAASSVVINGGGLQFANADEQLLVSFNFSMTAGGISMYVDATAQTNDSISSNAGSITIANPCTISVNTVNIPAGGMPHLQWNIFNASTLFGNNSTVFVGPNVNWGWAGFTYTYGYTPGNKTFFLQS